MFTEPFMQRALLAALFLGPLCAFMGVFVTARRMAFFSDTISHAALTGVALGFWFGLADPTWPNQPSMSLPHLRKPSESQAIMAN